MKCRLVQEYDLNVFDINIPMKKTSLRHDFRLICRIARDEHDSNVNDAGPSIRSRMGLTEPRWNLLLNEGEKEHRLWSGNRLTEHGLRCAEDGLILENEDGVHRFWVVDAPQPIGLRILHCEAWEDLQINKDSTPPKESDTDILKRLGQQNLQYDSIVNENLKIRYDPPPWYKRIMKSSPTVLENKHHRSSVKVYATYETGMHHLRYTLSGKIRGIRMKEGSADLNSNHVTPIKSGEIRFDHVELDTKHAMDSRTLTKELDTLLQPLLAEGQSWIPESQSIRTTHDALRSGESQSMQTSLSISNLSASNLDSWEKCELDEVLLQPVNIDEARKWIAELYWAEDRGYLPSNSVEDALSEMVEASAFINLTLDDLIGVPASDWLPSSAFAPLGSSWFFRALQDHGWALGVQS